MLNARKEGSKIIFNVDGRVCTYDLATHETIGFSGRPVKTLQSQLNGYTVDEAIMAFDDERYKRYLKYVAENSSRNHITRAGTIFENIHRFKNEEQYFAAGINRFLCFPTPLSQIPKTLMRFVRDNNIDLTRTLLDAYNIVPNGAQTLLAYEGDLTADDKRKILVCGAYIASNGKFYRLLTEFNYNPTMLVRYFDRVINYEAVSADAAVDNLYDYASMASKLSGKYDRFPRNLLTTHAIMVRNYNRLKEKFDAEAFAKRRKPHLEMEVDGYIFMYPNTVEDIKDEAVQQHNCVASYISRVLNGGCDIMFLRNAHEPRKSLVTLEIIDGCKVVQAYQRFNSPISDSQRDAIDKWEHIMQKEREKTA